ncbi:MAG: hypothetical protein U1E76_05650 [Planctomycetota bacterium]
MSSLEQPAAKNLAAKDTGQEVRLMSPMDFPGPKSFGRLPIKGDVLVLDLWEGGGTAYELAMQGGQPRVRSSFPVPDLLAEPGLADPNIAAELHKSLVSLNITVRDTIVVLPDTIVKHTELTLPRLPRRALAAVLAQKAIEIEGVDPRDVVWGYHATDLAETNQQQILLLACASSRLMAIGRGLTGVGLSAVAMIPSTAALCRVGACFANANGEHPFSLILLERDRARLSLFRNGVLFYDRSARLGDDAEGQRASLMRQVQRALLNYQQRNQEDPVRNLFVASVDLQRGKDLAADLTADLLLPLNVLSPSWLLPHDEEELPQHADQPNGMVAGALLLFSERKGARADLLPSELRTKRRDRLLATVVLAMALCSWGLAALIRARLEADAGVVRQIAQLQGEEIKSLASVEPRHAAMRKLRGDAKAEAQQLQAILGPNLDYDGFFHVLSACINGDLQLTSVRVEVRPEDQKKQPAAQPNEDRRRKWSFTVSGICPRKYLEAQSLVQDAIKRMQGNALLCSVASGPLQQAADPVLGAVTRFGIRGTILAMEPVSK